MKAIVLYLFFFMLSLASFAQEKTTIQALEKFSKGYVVEAFQDFDKNSNLKDLWAQFFLAQCYEKGYGTNVNHTEAFRYYRKTAERGLAVGQMALANCYRKGIGIMPDSQKAVYWEEKASGKYNPQHLTLLDECFNEACKYSHNYYLASNNNNSINNIATNVGNNINSGNTTINITYAQPMPVQTPAPTQISNYNNSEVVVTNNDDVQSDVDKNIPQNTEDNELTFVVIIANENYQEVENVPYSIKDGEIFAKYCKKTLGIPGNNISVVKNATANNMKREIRWLTQILNQYNGSAKAIIYYAGHGLPDEETKDAYLLPVDGYGDDPTTGYSLKNLYNELGEAPSSSTLVLLDACFSGATRDGNMLVPSRGVAIKPKEVSPGGNTIVISATHGNETAYPYKEKGHGLFTYFLLKKLQETNGNVSLGELSNYVIDQVGKHSIIVNRKSQTPNVSVSSSILNQWESIRLR